MTGQRFSIDTNILVYSIDKEAGGRRGCGGLHYASVEAPASGPRTDRPNAGTHLRRAIPHRIGLARHSGRDCRNPGARDGYASVGQKSCQSGLPRSNSPS